MRVITRRAMTKLPLSGFQQGVGGNGVCDLSGVALYAPVTTRSGIPNYLGMSGDLHFYTYSSNLHHLKRHSAHSVACNIFSKPPYS